jgi:hypothetical protein
MSVVGGRAEVIADCQDDRFLALNGHQPHLGP